MKKILLIITLFFSLALVSCKNVNVEHYDGQLFIYSGEIPVIVDYSLKNSLISNLESASCKTFYNELDYGHSFPIKLTFEDNNNTAVITTYFESSYKPIEKRKEIKVNRKQLIKALKNI